MSQYNTQKMNLVFSGTNTTGKIITLPSVARGKKTKVFAYLTSIPHLENVGRISLTKTQVSDVSFRYDCTLTAHRETWTSVSPAPYKPGSGKVDFRFSGQGIWYSGSGRLSGTWRYLNPITQTWTSWESLGTWTNPSGTSVTELEMLCGHRKLGLGDDLSQDISMEVHFEFDPRYVHPDKQPKSLQVQALHYIPYTEKNIATYHWVAFVEV